MSENATEQAFIFPASFGQERLWFLHQLEPDSFTYNIPLALRFCGPLDVTMLEQSLREIVRRHEALRTSFSVLEDRPVQLVEQAISLPLSTVDLRDLPESGRVPEIKRLIDEEIQQPFDLTQGPLLRAKLLCVSNEDHVFILTMHHIVSDGWSLDVFFRELGMLYDAFVAGQPSPLPELPIQYADYAVWQREWLQGEVLATQLDYWKRQLAHVPTVLELPVDHPRKAVQSSCGAQCPVVLPQNLVRALVMLSRQEGATLFMTLLATFQVLLCRYTGQQDVVVGSPVAGRNQVETEMLVGFFINTLVLRSDLSGELSFRQLLNQVREMTLEAYDHQDLPFERLVEEIQPERTLSHNPLFQVMFALQNASGQQLELTNVIVQSLPIHNGTAKLDLSLSLTEERGMLIGEFVYNTDLFEATTIERMAGHFQTLLEGIVTDPDCQIGELPLLTEAERHQLLVEWNDTATDYPRDRCVHQLFEAQVERTPEAVAVVFEDQQLTYRELNQRANQLAHYLQRMGVGPEVLVGIYVERSLEMLVGLLGILKAGGAYVPLDPSYPSERLAFMLADTAAPVLLTQERLLDRLPEHGAQVVCLDRDRTVVDRESEENLASGVGPENLVYVIYTSGSTGRPKGIAIIHRSVTNYLIWCTSAYRVDAGQGVPIHSSIGFDLTVTSLFSPIMVGARAIMLPQGHGLEALNMMLQLGIDLSLIKVTPSHLDAFSQILALGNSKAVIHSFIVGGEPLLGTSLSFWRDRDPNVRIVNEYGPTETVVGCCTYEVSFSSDLSGNIPIGRPIANTEIYLLDKYLNPVPVGVPGELHIGGVGLARGYLNRPELTAEVFIPNPFRNGLATRLYKSGDLARYRSDGTIEFLGRSDNQVKIRGFRVELGEIEAMLNQHSEVKDVVVAAHGTGTEKRLVAYVVAANKAPPITKLRASLSEKLPEYMVPTIYVFLDELPLTPHGKVDRAALPTPDNKLRQVDDAYIAPRDSLECALVRVFEEVLNVQPVGVTDKFFDIGGHSLLAMHAVTRIRAEVGGNVPLAMLFSCPTVELLANALRQPPDNTSPSSLVPIQRNGSLPPFFCVHSAPGHAFVYAQITQYLQPEQPFFGLQSRGLDESSHPLSRVEDMATQYLEDVYTVQSEGPYRLGGWSVGGLVAFEMARQLEARTQAVDLLVLLDTPAPSVLPASPFNDYITTSDDDSKVWSSLAWGRAHLSGIDLSDYLHSVYHLDPPAQIIAITSRLQELHLLPRGIDAPTIKRMIDVYRSNCRASLDYYPSACYTGDIVLILSELRTQHVETGNQTLGWDRFVAGAIAVHVVPGDHVTIMAAPNVSHIADILRRYMGPVLKGVVSL